MTQSKIFSILYKEYILLETSLHIYGAIFLFYCLLTSFGLYPLSFTLTIGQIVVILSPIALFQKEKTFQNYIYTLRSGRDCAVVGRYLFSLILTLLISGINLVIITFTSIISENSVTEALNFLFFATIFSELLLSIALPLFYALGEEKARPWFYLLVVTPVALFIIFRDYITRCIPLIQGNFHLYFFMLALCAMALFFSCGKSRQILWKKDGILS